MKKLILLSFVFILISSCKKRKEIEYPATLAYEENALTLTNVIAGETYSFGAKLGKKAELKIVLTQVAGNGEMVWGIGLNDQNGWKIDPYVYETKSQTFKSTESGEINLKIVFPSPGACRVDYYENSNSLTKSEILYWN